MYWGSPLEICIDQTVAWRLRLSSFPICFHQKPSVYSPSGKSSLQKAMSAMGGIMKRCVLLSFAGVFVCLLATISVARAQAVDKPITVGILLLDKPYIT